MPIAPLCASAAGGDGRLKATAANTNKAVASGLSLDMSSFLLEQYKALIRLFHDHAH